MSNAVKTIARDFMQAWSVGGENIVDTLAAPNLTVFYSHFPAPIQGVEQFKEILRQTHASFPDLKLTVQAVLGEGDQFVVHWRYQGTHQKGEVFGIQPRGQPVSVSGITFLRVNNGKVVEERGIVDNFSLLQQLKADATKLQNGS
jgi:steroid delta-isomerase-like uncharacterized protein